LENYDVIGFSVTNIFQLTSAIFMAGTLRQLGSRAHLTLGGHAVAVAGADLVAGNELYQCFDSVVIGGGADVLATLCEEHLRGETRRIYLANDASPRFRFQRSSFPTDQPYRIELQHDVDDLYLSPHRVFSIYSSLGCSYGACTFCGSNRANAPYVPRQVSVLVDEMEALRTRYGIRHFTMSDNNFDPKRAASFCRELEERGVSGLSWQCTSRVYPGLDVPLLRRMRAQGCVSVNMGIESASDRILQRMQKGHTAAVTDQVLLNMEEAGMPIHTYCICGFPGETAEDSEITAAFLLRHRERLSSIYFQNYEGQLAAKVFADALGEHTEGYNAERMLHRLMEVPAMRDRFSRQGHLLRRHGYPLIEDHNFLYMAHDLSARAEERER